MREIFKVGLISFLFLSFFLATFLLETRSVTAQVNEGSVVKLFPVSTSISSNQNNNSILFSGDKFGVNISTIGVKVNDEVISIPSDFSIQSTQLNSNKYKFGYNFSINSLVDFSTEVSYFVKASEAFSIDGTTIQGNSFRIDYSDAVASGFDVTISRDSSDSATIKIGKSFSAGLNMINIDPIIESNGQNNIYNVGQKGLFIINGVFYYFHLGSGGPGSGGNQMNYTTSLNGTVWNPPRTWNSSDSVMSLRDVIWNTTHFIVGTSDADATVDIGYNVLSISADKETLTSNFRYKDGEDGVGSTCAPNAATFSLAQYSLNKFILSQNGNLCLFIDGKANKKISATTTRSIIHEYNSTNIVYISPASVGTVASSTLNFSYVDTTGTFLGNFTLPTQFGIVGSRPVINVLDKYFTTLYVNNTNNGNLDNSNMWSYTKFDNGTIVITKVTMEGGYNNSFTSADERMLGNRSIAFDNTTMTTYISLINATGLYIKNQTNTSLSTWSNWEQILSRTVVAGDKIRIDMAENISVNSTHRTFFFIWGEDSGTFAYVYSYHYSSGAIQPTEFNEFNFIWNNNTQSVFLNKSFDSLFLNVSRAKITNLLSTINAQTILPSSNLLYDLGSITFRWLNIFTQNVNATGDVNATRIFENGNIVPTAGLFKLANYTAAGNQTSLNISFTPKKHIFVEVYINYTNASTRIGIRFNNDSQANYAASKLVGATSTDMVNANNVTIDTGLATFPRKITIDIANPAGQRNKLCDGKLTVQNVLGVGTAPSRSEFSCVYVNTSNTQIGTINIFPYNVSTSSTSVNIGKGSYIIVYGEDG